MKNFEDVATRQFTFTCDSTSLDFIGTLKARREPNAIELLVEPVDAAVWLHEAGVVDEVLDFSPADLRRALELRDAVATVVDAHLAREAFPADALATLNATAAKPDPVAQLTGHGRAISGTPTAALSAVAREAIELLSGPAASQIKECAREGCNQVFVDRSRGGRREWCSMELCGARVKAREYRARKSGAAASATKAG